MAKTKTVKSKKAVKKAAKKVVKKVASVVRVAKELEKAGGKGPMTAVSDVNGKKTGTMTLPAELFAAKVNKNLLATAVRVYLSRQREGSAATKTRGQVEGSTRKIYRQKGTGRARHGGIRAPIFVGGGIAFGPVPRDYRLHLPKKMLRAALASALTAQYNDGNVRVVEGLEKLQPKTKFMAKALSAISPMRPLLLVIAPNNSQVVRTARNIKDVEIIHANSLNPYISLSHKTLLFTKQAVGTLKDTFIKE